MNEKNEEEPIKLAIMGMENAGKTTLLNILTQAIEETPKSPPSMNPTKGVERNNFTLFQKKAVVWDFGGQDQFRFFLPDFCKGALGCLVVFDLTRYTTFEKIEDWIRVIEENVKGIPRILVGNKADKTMSRTVNQSVIDAIVAKEEFSAYFETSAKTGQNILEPFAMLTLIILKRLETLSLDVEKCADIPLNQPSNKK